MVTWYRPEITELAIRTIARNTKSSNYRLIVTDNGSPSIMRDMLQNLQDEGLIDDLILFNRNHGLEYARNYGLSLCKSKFIICADNDCLPEPMNGGKDWTERLVELMDNNPQYAAISCRTSIMVGTGNIFEDESKPVTDFPHPGGSLRIMVADIVRAVGGWQETSGRGSEERYIGAKLHEYGYKTGFATHIRTLHLFGNRGRTDERWGYPRGWEPATTGHSDVDHPALRNGDSFEEVEKYAGKALAEGYFK